MVPGFGVSAECQSIGTSGKKQRNQWQEIDGLLFSPQNSQLVHILSFHSQAVVSLFIFPTGTISLDSEPRGRRYVKNMIYVFIQGPSIVLPVWRCIMFNGSYIRACMKLRIVQKIRFCLLESGRTKPWCPGLVSRPSAQALVARSRGLVIQPPKLLVGAYFELSFLG